MFSSLMAGSVTGMAQPFQGNPSDSVDVQSILRPGEDVDSKIKKNFFVTAEITKDECYAGEALMASFKAYSRLNANSQVLKRPSLTGFSVVEMVDAYSNQPGVEKVKGDFYYVHLIRKVQLFPIQAGSYTLDEAEVESVVQFIDPRDKSGFRLNQPLKNSRSRGHAYVQKRMSFLSPEVSVNVRPLPEDGQPAGFLGAVGRFSVSVESQDNPISQKVPATVRLIITGTGNFPLITDPDVEWPASLKVSPPAVSEDVNPYVFPLSGAKIFEYTVQARDTGRVVIPSVNFSYFNPGSATYHTATSQPLELHVIPGKKQDSKLAGVAEKIKANDIPLHYYYFGIVALGIFGWIVYQVLRVGKKTDSGE